jgi:hypothetical protein
VELRGGHGRVLCCVGVCVRVCMHGVYGVYGERCMRSIALFGLCPPPLIRQRQARGWW